MVGPNGSTSHRIPRLGFPLAIPLLAAVLGACGPAEIEGGWDDPTDDEQWREEAASGLSGKVGLSLIGLTSPHYDCDDVVAAFGRAPIVFGYLERTFGDDRRCLNRLLDHPQFAGVRVHIINGPCVRNRRCDRNEIVYGETIASLDRKLDQGDRALLDKIRAEMVRVRNALGPHLRDGKRYLVSPILEHDVRSARGMRRLVDMARSVFGSRFRVVNNPVSGATDVGADYREWHGDRPAARAPCLVDPDGSDVSDFGAYADRYAGCRMILGWNSQMNCLNPGEDFRAPRDRTHCPTRSSLAPFARVIQSAR